MSDPERNSTSVMSKHMETAMKLPSGARFFRCALQVNPFEYLLRQSKNTAFKSEAEYNKAIVENCKEVGIEVIGVTDHYRVESSMNLVHTARKEGLWAFSGFEAKSKDGVHFLCLFDPENDDNLERFLGECGIHKQHECSPTGKLDCLELLERSKEWGGTCIAAHVASSGGVLETLFRDSHE